MCELKERKLGLAGKIVLSAAAAIFALALLILVPTSPALIVDWPVRLTTLYTGGVDMYGEPAGLPITAYALCIAVGAALSGGLTMLLSRKRCGCAWKGLALAMVSGVCALVCSHLLFCAVRWSYIINDLGGTSAFVVRFWEGGYTMYGAILGGLLGAVIFAKVRRESASGMLDLLIPGMALLIACGRFGEQFTLQGMASYRAAEALQGIPFAMLDEWGSPALMVYAYETLAAVIALAAALVVLLRKGPAGRAAETGLAVISVMQIMLESWRGDELIKFGFVCLNMICAAVVVVFILTMRIIRIVKKNGWSAWTIVRIPLFLAGVAAVVLVEFGLDGKMGITAPNTLLFAIQAAAIIAMGAAVLTGDGRTAQA